MATRVYKLTTNAATTTNAAAQVTIQKRGAIVAIYGDSLIDSSADNGSVTHEVSFSSTNQISTNDTIGPIIEMSHWNNFTTSGEMEGGRSCVVSGIAIPVEQGDRIYLHVLVAGTISAERGTFYVYVEER